MVGFALFILAIATMGAWLAAKPVSIVIVVLILLQIVLGESTLHSGNQAVAFLHFVNAMAISGTFMAMRWEQTAKAAASPDGSAGARRSPA